MALTYMMRHGWNKHVIERTLKVVITNFKRTGSFLEPAKISYPNTKIVMKMTSIGCPVQYEGKINGYRAYYRDRGDVWYMEVYKDKMFGEVLFRRGGTCESGLGLGGMLSAENRIMKHATVFVRKHLGSAK